MLWPKDFKGISVQEIQEINKSYTKGNVQYNIQCKQYNAAKQFNITMMAAILDGRVFVKNNRDFPKDYD